jgi:hypothetical protein
MITGAVTTELKLPGHAAGLGGRFPREYFTDEEVLRAEIWVPTQHKETWLNLRPVPRNSLEPRTA